MKKNFKVYCEESEFPKDRVQAFEKAMDGFVQSDVRLAVEFTFVDGDEIRRLNRETRNVDKVTDVLSYPTLDGIKGKPLKKKEHLFDVDEEGNLFVGSVVVCCDRAREQAEEYGHSLEREVGFLAVHSTLHLLGFDHMEEPYASVMRSREEEILNKMNLKRD